jgi:ubiquinone/menaquinone biosynthesis C-methylase UbiE
MTSGAGVVAEAGPSQAGPSHERNEERHEEGIVWSEYAVQYDLMAEMIPAYQENIARLRALITERGLSGNIRVCDLGAGTGNYIAGIADLLPDADYTHLDQDPEMSAIARRKYDRCGIRVTMVQDFMQRASFASGSFDLIVCVNALYAAAPQELVLRRVKRWLKPDGLFFVIDYGRQARIFDWGWYILKSSIRRRALGKLVTFALNSRHVISSTRRGSSYQSQGGYWLHSTQEFGDKLSEAGFIVEKLEPCYRGYADLAVCRPGADAEIAG